jgi:hypothetical protein
MTRQATRYRLAVRAVMPVAERRMRVMVCLLAESHGLMGLGHGSSFGPIGHGHL